MIEQEESTEVMEEQGGTLTPEQQEVLDIFVANGLKIIHTEQVLDAMLKQLEVDQDKTHAIGSVLAGVIIRLEDTAGENEINLDPEVVVLGAIQLFQEILIIGQETDKLPDFDLEDIRSAIGHAVGIYFDNGLKTGKVTQEELVALAQMFEQDPQVQQAIAEAEAVSKEDLEGGTSEGGEGVDRTDDVVMPMGGEAKGLKGRG